MRKVVWLLLFALMSAPLTPGRASADPLIGDPFRIDGNQPGTVPKVACSAEHEVCLVTWSMADGSILYRLVSERRGPVGGANMLAWGEEPDVAYNDSSDVFLIAYLVSVPSLGESDIYVAAIDAAGEHFQTYGVATTAQLDVTPRVAAAGGAGFLVLWQRQVGASSWQVLSKVLPASGDAPDPSTPENIVSTYPFGSSQHLAVAYSPSGMTYAVVCADPSSFIGIQLVSTAGIPVGAHRWASWLMPSGYSPSLVGSITDQNRPFFMVLGQSIGTAVWREGFFLGSDGTPQQPQFTFDSVGGLDPDFLLGAVTATRGLRAFAAAWEHKDRDMDWDIWLRLVRPDGVMSSAAVASVAGFELVGSDEESPAMSTGRSRTLLVWSGSLGGAPTGIFGRWLTTGYTFAGRVRTGTPQSGHALAGVTVQLYGDSDANLFTGPPVLIGETVTAADGSFELTYGPGYEYPYFHVVEVDPPGTVSVDATAPSPGACNPANHTTITYAGPIELGYYSEIQFWDQQTAPQARFNITPATGSVTTNFTFDAQATTDAEELIDTLVCRWDWENDGTWDTGWSNSFFWTQHKYATAGTRTVKVQVRDSSGLTGTATHQLSVTGAQPSGHQVRLPLVAVHRQH